MFLVYNMCMYRSHNNMWVMMMMIKSVEDSSSALFSIINYSIFRMRAQHSHQLFLRRLCYFPTQQDDWEKRESRRNTTFFFFHQFSLTVYSVFE